MNVLVQQGCLWTKLATIRMLCVLFEVKQFARQKLYTPISSRLLRSACCFGHALHVYVGIDNVVCL